MKTLLITGLLITALSGQALSMGHPHNVFAARKQMRAKTSLSVSKPKAKPAAHSCWQPVTDTADLGRRLLRVLSRVRVTRSY